VPYGEVGGDYYGLFETRSDKSGFSDSVKYGGVPAWHWVGGVQIQLDAFDREGLWQTDADYGINHIYLTVAFRSIYGLKPAYDLTGQFYEGGVLFEF
jgi:hypothetical protein